MSEALRAGYKLTEVGITPNDWTICRIDSLGTGTVPAIKAGPFGSSLTKVTYVPDGYKVYGQEQVIRGDHLYGDYFIPITKYRELESCAVSPGDILLSLVGTMGKLLVVPVGAPAGVINPRLIRFSFDKKRVDPEFFKNLFEAGPMQSCLARSAQGGTMGVLNAGMLRPVNISLPSLPEQRAIAAALSDIDALLAKLDTLIAKKRNIKQATMQQLLTGQTRLPGFSGEWEVKRLGLIFSRIANGAVYKPTNSLGVQITRIETIANGTIDYSRTGIAEDTPELAKYKIIPGDILFSHINSLDHIGKVAIFNSEQSLYHGMNLLLLRANREANSQFLYFWFTSLPVRRQTRNLAKQAVSQASINTKELKALEIRLPLLQEQTAIATVISDMDTELATLESRRDKTHALKQGMMQELLTGRIRLV